MQVNAALAAKLMAEGQDAVEGITRKDKQQPATELLADERFKSLFEDKAFAIDEQSEEYKALHPNAGACPLPCDTVHKITSQRSPSVQSASANPEHCGSSMKLCMVCEAGGSHLIAFLIAEANQRQKQLLKEHFEELEEEDNEEDGEEDEANAGTSADEADDDVHVREVRNEVTHQALQLIMCSHAQAPVTFNFTCDSTCL